MKSLLYSCLLTALASTSFAAAPQYKPRTDITTGFKLLYGMAVADFNGDGKPDIAATDNDTKNVYIYLNDGAGAFGAPKTIPLTMNALGPGAIVAGDFNEDGKQDLMVGTVSGSQSVLLLTGNGDGTFTQQQDLPNSFGFSSAAATDLNHDNHLDLVFGMNGPIFVYLGDGHGGFQQKTFSNQGDPGLFTSVGVADFNKDGNPDLIVVSPVQTAGVRYYPGNGDGTFSFPTILTSGTFPQPSSIATADFNADGDPDLAIGAMSLAAVIPGKGGGTFNTSAPAYLNTPIGNNQNAYAPLVAAADVDNDKKIDAVVSDDTSGTINIFLNDGTGEFLQTTPDFSAAIDRGGSRLAVADLNGDGILDVVVGSNVTQNISVFLSIKPKAAPAVTLTSNASSQFVGIATTFIANVGGTNSIPPTGSVTLMDGATSLGQQTLDANGQVVFTLSNLTTGQHSLSAVYAGDSNYTAVTSPTLTQVITDMEIASTTTSQTVAAGSNATYNFTVTPTGGLTGIVTLTCSQLPSLTSCDPVTTTLTGQPTTTTLTLHTTAPVRSQSKAVRYGFLFVPVFAICCLSRSRRAITTLVALSTICVLGSFLSGCSSGSSSTSTPPPVTVTPGTPTGTAAFTVTATITAGGQTLTRSTTANLVVQ